MIDCLKIVTVLDNKLEYLSLLLVAGFDIECLLNSATN
ncbi:hypothetical protein CWATWH8502_4264 [Crocosphaera watsonii WH 8502]|uniref:Uncharacterized protein n=3 Tax=Crocosphaera watsonii TaxID=263511 RepID=T2IWI4_CROWT|nr:hypothetical protein CWATWH8502_4264 [Crocosphaera watsonii WH 8502]CCQ57177.1 hypothetical protein CWATWH0005_3187 [Crocosphaera watsonii WH 0005]CCQ62035.1 hypothetical protein CWATWH0401_4533 [Crocosphaera watsonii WH 0401]